VHRVILLCMPRDDASRARAAARANMTLRVVELAQEEAPDLSSLSPSARVAMVWELTLDAWASSGQPIPDYDRSHAPGRMLRSHGSEAPRDDAP